MTRETKIGLFVGMGVIILIGILISDHLSHAQQQGSPDYSKYFPDASKSLTGGTETSEPKAVASSDPNPLVTPGNVVKPAEPAPVKPLKVDEADIFVQDPKATKTAGGTSTDSGTSTLPPKPVAFGEGGKVKIEAAKPTPSENNVAKPFVPPTTKETVHVVKDGETLSELSRKYFGRTSESNRIYEANKGVIVNPNRLRAGMKLVIPTKTVASATTTSTSSPQPVITRLIAETPAEAEYVIQEGDTLGSIAEEKLGNRQRWEEIYSLNKDRIKSPNAMKVGTPVRLPNK